MGFRPSSIRMDGFALTDLSPQSTPAVHASWKQPFRKSRYLAPSGQCVNVDIGAIGCSLVAPDP